MYAGRQCVGWFVRSSVRPYVRTSFTKCAIMYYEQTAGPKRANFAKICILTRYTRPPIFIQIVNGLDVYFQGQNSNRIDLQGHNALEPSGQ